MRSYTLYLVLLFSMILSACTDDSQVEEPGEDQNAATNNNTGDITIGLMEDIVTLDPHGSNDTTSAQVRGNIYETLVYQDIDMSLGSGLAEEWEEAESKKWNFKLKEDKTFHNGSNFTAEDVKATLDRVNDTAVASQAAFLYEMITEVEVVDEHEVNIHTEYPFAPLPSHLAHNTAGIISKELIDQDYQAALDEAGVDMTADEYYELREEGGSEYEGVVDEISAHIGSVVASEPDGTGHLKFQSRSAGEEVVLESFEGFQGEERNFNNVTFRVIPENGARIAELETGGIQVAAEVDSTSAERVKNNEETELVEQESVRTDYLGFNVEKEPFDDVKVRQAISHAIDRDEIISGVYDDMGIKAEGPLAPDVWGYDENLEGVEYDMERAKELLAETDVAEGFNTTLWVNDDQQVIDSAVYIQEKLSELNIEVTIEQLEWGTYLERTGNGEHEMFLLGWTTVTADADNGLYALFHSDNHGSTGNRSFYSNEEVDALLEKGRKETDEEARFEAYSQAQEILVEEAPAAYLFHTNFAIGVNTSQVNDVEIDPIGIIRLENVTFE
ncbi:glutathione ABC transporter substrate-binding protein [Salinicoccus roseus]|nr:glutathione ABC transporter substrate-binding protein [Salinicoccus roseus]MDB0580197.1 glutathione ABC transporter substrate-binding protein [Salinicoccus roseus]